MMISATLFGFSHDDSAMVISATLFGFGHDDSAMVISATLFGIGHGDSVILFGFGQVDSALLGCFPTVIRPPYSDSAMTIRFGHPIRMFRPW